MNCGSISPYRQVMENSAIRPSWDETRMAMCRELARRSTCWKKKTASLITKDDKIISEGYNGTLAGEPHCEDVGPRDRLEHREWSLSNEIHAEMNAIFRASRVGIPRNSTLYTILSPCINCAKAIYASGIRRVVYEVEYKENGLDFLRARGVAVDKCVLPEKSSATKYSLIPLASANNYIFYGYFSGMTVSRTFSLDEVERIADSFVSPQEWICINNNCYVFTATNKLALTFENNGSMMLEMTQEFKDLFNGCAKGARTRAGLTSVCVGIANS